ncbi:mitochondrial carrier domain-containing protein [Hypomontagnella monticulosa]|nr:mitochondrial carrier domain-containing protein [Hypomontagnella monticulosa]
MPSTSRRANYTTGNPAADKFLPALHHAVSGSAGTLISTCALYPLSLVITRLQAQRQLPRQPEGGDHHHLPHHPSSSNNKDRTSSTSSHRDDGTTTTGPSGPAAATGAARGRTYGGLGEAFSRIWSSGGGPKAFYTGLAQDAAKSALDSFLFFLFYEWFRSARLAAAGSNRRRRGLNVLEELAIGMAAGACARLFTTPIANVVTRKQTAGLVSGEEEISVREIIESIRKEKGFAGFWSGYSATLILTLNPSITFFLQDFFKKRVVAEDRWENPAPHVTFLLAAVSKAIASTITYPFQTAKTRLQTAAPTAPEAPKEGRAEKAPAETKTQREIEAAKDREQDRGSMEAQASESVEAPKEGAKEGEAPMELEASGEAATPESAQTASASTEATPADAAPVEIPAQPIPDEVPISPKTPAPREPIVTHNVAPPERGTNPDASAEAIKAIQNLGKRSIFGTVTQIARTEGVSALYDGILGELLKGFLSHGTAMLAKDIVHRLLFRLYFVIAGMLAEMRARRARMGQRMAKGGRVGDMFKKTVERFVPSSVRGEAAVPTRAVESEPMKLGAPSESAGRAALPAPPTPALITAPSRAPSPTPAPTRASTPAPAPMPVPVQAPAPLPALPAPPSPMPMPSSPLPSSPSKALPPSMKLSRSEPAPPVISRPQLPPPPPTPPRQETQELRALRYRLDNEDAFGIDKSPATPASPSFNTFSSWRRSSVSGNRNNVNNAHRLSTSLPSTSEDYGVNMVANMIDGTQRGIKHWH